MSIKKIKIKSFWPAKIRHRLMIGFIGCIIILILPLLLWIYHLQKQSEIDSYEDMVRQTTLSIANNTVLYFYQDRYRELQGLIDNLKSDEHVVEAKLIDEQCKILAHNKSYQRGAPSTDSLSLRAIKLKRTETHYLALPGHGAVICIIVPICRLDNSFLQNPTKPHPALIVSYSLKQVYAELHQWKTILIGMGLVCLAIGIFLAYVLSKGITSPLLKLHRGVNQLTAGQMNYQIQELPQQSGRANGEVAEISQAFNRMVQQLNLMLDEKIKNQSLITLGEFAALVVHHLKNPLYGIITWVDIMSQYVSKKESATRTRALENGLQNISQALNKLNNFIKNTLNFAKPFSLVSEPVNLHKIIKQIIKSLLFNEELQLLTKFDDRIKCLNLDAPRFSMALSCLMTNAIEAMPSGGILTVETRLDSNIVISISDTGVGIPEKIQAKIFNPFYSTKNFGDGMGLMFVKKIVESHGGVINFTSEEGKGSDFQIVLPLTLMTRPNAADENRNIV